MQNMMNSDNYNLVNMQTWERGRHLVRCFKIIQETHDVRTFFFRMHSPMLFNFKPGQFVTLELMINNEEVMRSYTISSAPSLPYSFSITVKRVPGGLVSNWLHDNVSEGDSMAVHGPAGQFNSSEYPADRILLLSGGVGITPVMSMARWFFNINSDVDIVFVHSARSPVDIIYRAELDYMSTCAENFKLHVICEHIPVGQAWSGYRGYLNHSLLQIIAPDYAQREIFCCGPSAYMLAVHEFLHSAGFDMSHYHEESFGDINLNKPVTKAGINAATTDILTTENELLTVHFLNSNKSISVVPGTTLIEAATNAGLKIPKACGMGICGTCKVRVMNGIATMSHNGGIDDEETEQGYVLSCCTALQTNIEVDY